MRTRLLIIILSIIAGLLAGYALYNYGKNLEKKVEVAAKTVEVLVATDEIKAGSDAFEMFNRKKIELKKVPLKYVPENAIKESSLLSGKIIKYDLNRGQIIVLSMLEAVEEAGITFEIPDGYRAVAVKVDEVSGVSGKISTGNRIDIIASFKQIGADLTEPVAKIILQNVLVVEGLPRATAQESTGRTLTGGADRAQQRNTVILALKPEEAEKLVFALENGSVYLALRPHNDRGVVQTPGVRIDRVLK